jgi:hypothetical protein
MIHTKKSIKKALIILKHFKQHVCSTMYNTERNNSGIPDGIFWRCTTKYSCESLWKLKNPFKNQCCT